MAYYVYLLASRKHGTLYLGVTRDLVRRGHEHRTKAVDGFTSRYGVDRLVWFEIYDDAATAITREKQLKKWRRAGKFASSKNKIPNGLTCIPVFQTNTGSMDSAPAPSGASRNDGAFGARYSILKSKQAFNRQTHSRDIATLLRPSLLRQGPSE